MIKDVIKKTIGTHNFNLHKSAEETHNIIERNDKFQLLFANLLVKEKFKIRKYLRKLIQLDEKKDTLLREKNRVINFKNELTDINEEIECYKRSLSTSGHLVISLFDSYEKFSDLHDFSQIAGINYKKIISLNKIAADIGVKSSFSDIIFVFNVEFSEKDKLEPCVKAPFWSAIYFSTLQTLENDPFLYAKIENDLEKVFS